MMEFMIVAIFLTIMYISLGGLMKAASKFSPIIPNVNNNIDKDTF